MKILLIEPAKAPGTIGGDDIFLYEPLALEYLAAGVCKNHDVKILDLRLEKNLQQILEGFSPDVVGVTSYTVHVNTARSLCDQIKAWNPEVLTVVGGHHATVAPNDFLSPTIDLIVLGEGVFVFEEIVERFEQGRGFDGIPGLAFARNGGLGRTEPPPVVDLDAFPFPARELTDKYRHRYYSEWMKPLASMRTSKGCPYRCSFCALWKISGGRYLRREPSQVAQELATIGEDNIFFADDESLVDVARMKTLASMIKDAGLQKQYFLYGRSDTIARNPDLLERWREIGLQRVFVGLEFSRDQDLAYINKGSTTRDNESAVRILQALDIEIYASLIVRPEFTREDFAALRQYCRDLGLTFATFAVLTPLPGTDLYEEVESQLITHDYDYFDFLHTLLPTELPLKDFYREYARLFTSAIPLTRQATTLRRFSWSEVLPLMIKNVRVVNRVRRAYLDYEDRTRP
ncbi:MAG: radical SAM protein [Anaerolineae bacterium]